MDQGKYSHIFSGTGKDLWMEYSEMCRKYKAVNLGVGAPDYGAPKILTDALLEVAKSEDPTTHQYAAEYGHPRLLNVLSKIYSPRFKRELSTNGDIMVTNSATESLYLTIINYVKKGEEVIIMEPYFARYTVLIRLAEGTVRYLPLRPKKDASTSADWILDKSELESMFNSKTKVIIVNTPHNPTGKAFTADELQHIAELCKKWNVLCIADEVYEWMVYEPLQHIHIATLPGMWERTITVGSAGKTFGATGWRLGWAFGPSRLIHSLRAFHQRYMNICNSPLQEALARAMENEERILGQKNSYFATLKTSLQGKRDFMVEALDELGLRSIVPDAGVFILADWTKLASQADMEREEDEFKDYCFTKWMTKNLRVQAFPLTPFYSDANKHIGENFIRFCFMKKDESLEEAANVLKQWNK